MRGLAATAVALALLARLCGAQCNGQDFLELERLEAPPGDPSSLYGFGSSVAASAEWVFVGQPGFFVPGQVQVFRRDPQLLSRWNLARTLETGLVENTLFGARVAASGDLLAVGQASAGGAGPYTGQVHLYQRDLGGPGQWGLLRSVLAPTPDEASGFGTEIALSGEHLVVSTLDASFGGTLGTWVFRRDQGGPDQWGLVAEVWPVGARTALDGDTLLVGVPSDSSAAPGAGAVYVFRRNQGGPDQWGSVRRILAADAAADDGFGSSLALSGNTALIGAPGRDDAGVDSGAAYVFERNLGGPDAWGQARKLAPSVLQAGDELGGGDFTPLDAAGGVALLGDRAVVSARLQDSGATDSGAAFVFGRNQGGSGAWGELARLTPASPHPDGHFGVAGLADDLLQVNAQSSAWVYGPGALASATQRNDSGGVNPVSYTATPLLLGETFEASVDLDTSGHAFATLIGFLGPTETTLPGGQVLLATGGPQLFPRVIAPGPLARFQFAVPNQPTLCGLSLSTQAVHLGGVQPFALSNAVDLVVGTGL